MAAILNQNKRVFILSLLLFIFMNLLLFLFINSFHSIIPLNKTNYLLYSHHLYEDERITGGKFNIIRTLGQYDAQWYLKIAKDGYPPNPESARIKLFTAPLYAFFPLYPLTIQFVNIIIPNIEHSAFILSMLLMLLNFVSMYYIGKSLFPEKIVVRTIFLLFFYPFSIFFRSYYTEGLQLLLLLWFSYFLIKRSMLSSSVILSLINITKGNNIFLYIIYLVYLWKEYRKNKLSLKKSLLYLFISIVPFLMWMYLCYQNTGNPFFFLTMQKTWFSFDSNPIPLLYNLNLIFLFPFLPLHNFHYSKIDIISLFLAAYLLIKSKKYLKQEIWWISFGIWLLPLLAKDLMSFSRYQSISFALFFYVSYALKDKYYFLVLGISIVLLFLTSLFFVNWHWV